MEPVDSVGASGCEVAIIGGGLLGSMAAIMLRKRGLAVTVLESRAAGQPPKRVVGEAITEGSSVFFRHEIGLGDWLREHAFRKFGFDFVVPPRDRPAPASIDECHELLLSLTPIERIPGAFRRLIPTFHVDRAELDPHVAERAREAGARYLAGATVERVELGELDHTVHYEQQGERRTLRAKWVLDVSGRRRVLGRQLGINHPVDELRTASVWNRFGNVREDREFWSTFRGIDRRRHTIHFSGPGMWFWWIHLRGGVTSVGVSYDKEQHQPDVKVADRGFWEMVAKLPAVGEALAGAKPLEEFQYLAELPHRSDYWLSERGYAMIGDASAFVDALYSIGIEISCRQLTAIAPLIVAGCRGEEVSAATVARLNADHALTQKAVIALNHFKYKHAWHQPHLLMQTALYELGEIAELYHMQEERHWTPENLDRNYRLQWSSEARVRNLNGFAAASLADEGRDLVDPRLLAKALLPGRLVYFFTWPLWALPKARPYFFIITRAWAYMERLAQRHRLWPDFLKLMAGPRPTKATPGPQALAAEVREEVATAHPPTGELHAAVAANERVAGL